MRAGRWSAPPTSASARRTCSVRKAGSRERRPTSQLQYHEQSSFSAEYVTYRQPSHATQRPTQSSIPRIRCTPFAQLPFEPCRAQSPSTPSLVTPQKPTAASDATHAVSAGAGGGGPPHARGCAAPSSARQLVPPPPRASSAREALRASRSSKAPPAPTASPTQRASVAASEWASVHASRGGTLAQRGSSCAISRWCASPVRPGAGAGADGSDGASAASNRGRT